MYLKDCKKHLVNIRKNFGIVSNISTPVLDIFCEEIISNITNEKFLTTYYMMEIFFYAAFFEKSKYSGKATLRSMLYYRKYILETVRLEEVYWLMILSADFSAVFSSLYLDWFANLSKKDPQNGFNLKKINKYYNYLIKRVSAIDLIQKKKGNIKYIGKIEQIGTSDFFVFMIINTKTNEIFEQRCNSLKFFECFRKSILDFYDFSIGYIDLNADFINFWKNFPYEFTNYFINFCQANLELKLF